MSMGAPPYLVQNSAKVLRKPLENKGSNLSFCKTYLLVFPRYDKAPLDWFPDGCRSFPWGLLLVLSHVLGVLLEVRGEALIFWRYDLLTLAGIPNHRIPSLLEYLVFWVLAIVWDAKVSDPSHRRFQTVLDFPDQH